MNNKKLLLFFSVFFIFILASFYITYPLVFHLGDYATGLGDELLIAWIQKWDIHMLLSGHINSVFNANIYYPYHNTLAFSDTFFTSSILPFLFVILTGQPIAANNFTLISSIALLGFSIYLLTFYLTKDFLASLLGGIMVIFSPAVLGYSVHLQVLAIEWVALSILFFLKFLDTKKSRYFLWSLFFFVVQTYNSFLPGYFIIFSYVIIFIYHLIHNKQKIKLLLTKINFFALFFSLTLILPIAIPYFEVSKEFHYVRDIRDSIHFAIQPEDLLYTSNFSRLNNFFAILPFNKISQNNEFKPGYLGTVFSFLMIFSLGFFLKNYRKKENLPATIFVSIGILGLILSLGPFLHLGRHTIHKPFPIPLPYFLFYYVVPGFQGFRNSARWEMLFVLAFAVVIGLVLHKVLAKISLFKRILVYCLLIVGIIAEFNFPMHFVNVPQVKDFSKVYTWLSQQDPNAAMIELPIYNWNIQPYVGNELLREYENTLYFQKTVNGYSGFSPPSWQELITDTLVEFPSDKAISTLKKISVNYVVVHKNEYDVMARDGYAINKVKVKGGNIILNEINKTKQLKFVKRFGNDYIYQL